MKRLFRCQSNVLILDEPKLCISSRMKPLLRQLRASEVHYHMAAPGYLVFPGKAFHCDILLNIGVHFKAGRIQFLEFFRVIPPEQRKDLIAVIGKGHETYRDREGVKTPFLERELLEEYAQQIGLE